MAHENQLKRVAAVSRLIKSIRSSKENDKLLQVDGLRLSIDGSGSKMATRC